MNKKNNLALFTLLVAGLLSLFSINISAQNKVTTETEQSTKTCSGKKFVMPPSIAVNNNAFGDFIKVASLSLDERRSAFSKLSNEQKAAFIKVNLALQLVKRPNMTKEQQEFVLDSILKVSAAIYDNSDFEKVRRSEQSGTEMVNKAFALFSPKELGDFIEPLNANKDEEVVLLQKYEDLLKNGMNARRKIASGMPVNERVIIWKTQLAYHLATGKFSKNQNEFILEMLSGLTPEFFTSRLNLTKEEEAKAERVLASSISNVFTKDEGFAVFVEIGVQNYVKDESNPTTAQLTPTCTCNWSCSQGTCSGSGCISSEIGACGPFGTTRCNYLCVLE
jgi:hypothetical protein